MPSWWICDWIVLPTRRLDSAPRICVPRYIEIVRALRDFDPNPPDPRWRDVVGHDPVLFLNPQPIPPGREERSWLSLGSDATLGADISAVSTLHVVADRLLSPAMDKAKSAALQTLADAASERLPEGARFELVETTLRG